MRIYDPFRELEALRNEMDRFFGGLLPEHNRPMARLAFLPGRAARQYPRVNIAEDAGQIVVQALAPGVDPATLDVSVQKNTVTISGEKLGNASIAPEAVHRSERAAGRFTRTLEFKHDLNPDGVTAKYADGYLTVVLPKHEAALPKRIAVETA